VTEEESIEKLEKLTRQLIANELEAQRQLINQARSVVEDKIFRAYGILRGARVITSQETVELVSALRLGRTSGILPDVPYETINEILICSRPAHLQKIAGSALEARERDIFRAQYIRQRLN
jgi:protein arginine kinase